MNVRALGGWAFVPNAAQAWKIIASARKEREHILPNLSGRRACAVRAVRPRRRAWPHCTFDFLRSSYYGEQE